jgi:hypothetical protein
VPVPPVPAAAADRPVPGSRLRARLRAGVRRLAMWGAGPDGAYAAWPTAAVAVPPPGAGLVRRLALWGAGPDGAHLAWGGPRRPAPAPAGRPADAADRPAGQGPVVLTELPSTPTITSAAPSPAAASSPAGAARPVLPSPRPAGPALAPAGWPARPAATRSAPRAAAYERPLPRAPDGPAQVGGAVRARGDPAPHRARGSPRPPPAPDRPSCASSSGDVARPLPSSVCPTGPAPASTRG